MADTRFDVEVKAIDRIYRNVPFGVVTDWIQQGRLVMSDRLRPIGSSQWQCLKDLPALSVYFPRPDILRADDQAEGFEAVDLGFSRSRRTDDEDDDPDMIPLIDISLVLLVFFMMTASEMITVSAIETPPAEYANVIQPRQTLVVGMAMVDKQLRYYLGDQSDQPLSEQELFDQVDQKLKQGEVAEAVVKANPWIPFETVQKVLINLEKRGIKRIEAGVRDHRRTEQVTP